jgi:2-polyprenyl-6-methoxyphenol hydroxylase-like FAD-dependent oxidoreductase
MRRDSRDELTCASELHRRNLTAANTIFKLAPIAKRCSPAARVILRRPTRCARGRHRRVDPLAWIRRWHYVRLVRFVVAGGGVAGLAAALAVARAGHEAVVLERDAVEPRDDPQSAFGDDRRGIPHFFQPHAFLPRGRRILSSLAPDVLGALLDAGAEPQDVAARLHGERQAGDEDLVYLWVRRPIIEWALRRAAAREPAVELRPGARIAGLALEDGRAPRAAGVALEGGETLRGDVILDALGRYKAPKGWRRLAVTQADCGALYYCRYFELRDGVDHLDGGTQNPLNPRGDLGYMGFNTFRGDNRTYAVILLVPTHDRELRSLRDERVWTAACASMRHLDVMTSSDYGRPITGVMPMGGLMNVDCTGDPGVAGLVAVGDALCHTDPAFAYGLSFALAHADALGRAAGDTDDVDELADRYRAEVTPEAGERYALACDTDDARARRWNGEPLDMNRRDGCYPLFAFSAALAAAPHDDLVLRRTIRRISLLDRTAVFDEDEELHERIETIVAALASDPPPPAGPPRDELLAGMSAAAAAS